jgi:hypothetical protein
VFVFLVRPPRILGRRGVHLFAVALAWCGVALLAAVTPTVRGGDFFSYVPRPLYAGLWVLTGLLAGVCAFRRRPGADTPGFTVAVGVATARAAVYGWAWLDSLLPGVGGHGDPTGWFGAVCWAAVALVTANVAGWQEDAPPPVEDPS